MRQPAEASAQTARRAPRAADGRRARTSPRAGAIVILILAGFPALAQTAKPAAPPAPVSADPSVTTASYGDWTARCQKVAGDRPQRICEAVQTVTLPNGGAAGAQISLGRVGSGDPLKLVAVVPVDVWFPSTVKLSSGDKDPAGAELAWRRCLPFACFAELASADDLARRWRGETGQGRLTYTNGLDREVDLPVSFRGLAQALDALAKM